MSASNAGVMPFETGPRPDQVIGTPPLGGGVEMNMHPQTIELGRGVVRDLVNVTAAWAKHYPEDNTFANNQYGVPSLIVRTDFGLDPTTGDLSIYEVDDHPVGSAVHQQRDESAKVVYDRLRDQLPYPLARAFLDDGRPYAHDDHLWLPPRNPDGSVEIDGKTYGQSLVVARARRTAPGFGDFIDSLAPDSIMTARERDNKVSLVGMGLADLMSGSVEFEEMLAGLPDSERRRFVVKGKYSSRGEDVAVHGPAKLQGVSTLSQIHRNFKNTPIVVQDLALPPTMDQLGLVFTEEDHARFQSVPEKSGNAPKPYKFKPGSEDKYYTIFRVFSVFDPQTDTYIPTGGFWAARPNVVVHGASDTVFGQTTVDNGIN